MQLRFCAMLAVLKMQLTFSLFQLGDLQSSYNAAKIVCYVSSVEDAANFLFVCFSWVTSRAVIMQLREQ